MPQRDYKVTFPDGYIQTFSGPVGMEPVDAQNRAIQERAFKEDKIPSSYWSGVWKDLKQNIGDTLSEGSGKIGTAVSLAGGLAGQPEVVAAGPLIGRATQAVGEKIAGRDVTPTSASEVAVLGAEGALGAYGPEMVAKGIRGIAASTIPHQLPDGRWVAGLKGHGAVPWAIRTAAEGAQPAADALEKVTPKGLSSAVGQDIKTLTDAAVRLKTGASVDDIKTLTDAMNQEGMSPSAVAQILSKNDQGLFGKLMTLYMRSRAVK